jgi:hypothetical protein
MGRPRAVGLLLLSVLATATAVPPAAGTARSAQGYGAVEPTLPQQHVQPSTLAGQRAGVQRAAPRTERMPFVGAPAHALAVTVGLERVHLPRPASPRASAATFSSQRDPPAPRSI